MRDKDRIKPFCNEFAALWEKYPDLRFGQIISIAAHEKDIFYIEDDELMKMIQNHLK